MKTITVILKKTNQIVQQSNQEHEQFKFEQS